MRSDGQDRHPVSPAVVQTVDEVHVARAAAAGTHGQLAGHGGFGTGREGCRFLVTNRHPLDALEAPQAVVDAVQAVARHAPDALYTRIGQCFHQKVCNSLAHEIQYSLIYRIMPGYRRGLARSG